MSHGVESVKMGKCKETKHGTRVENRHEPCNNWLRTAALRVVKRKSITVELQFLFHKLVMLILEDFCGGLGVVEQLVDFFYLLPLNVLFSLNTA